VEPNAVALTQVQFQACGPGIDSNFMSTNPFCQTFATNCLNQTVNDNKDNRGTRCFRGQMKQQSKRRIDRDVGKAETS
jgi:hypothetical protein